MKVIVDGKEQKMASPSRILDIVNDENKDFLAARVDNRLREMNYIISSDCNVELLTKLDSAAMLIYQTTLRYLIIMAVKNIYPKAKVIFNYSVSRSIFATLSNLGHAFLEENLIKIQAELNRIIAADYPITRKTILKTEAEEYYRSLGWNDKVKTLKYRSEENVHIYECNGYKNYMFGYMLPSTGYIKKYNLRLYSPGFLITYPRSECKGKIPEFQEERIFRNALKEANIWSNIVKSGSISQMNEIVEAGKALEFINICEARHNRQLVYLVDEIMKRVDDIKLICIAGPSSSGKTTFTNRVRIELVGRGITPLMISMDDFYFDSTKAPKDEDGKPDLEHIAALDLKLFDNCIFRLIQGEEVSLPTYSFTTKERTFKTPIKLKPRQPIMIEGIHALNDKLAPSINPDSKYKIYIAPMTQYRIDDHNPISFSDIRLIRRMVRDYQFRNTTCEQTLSTWQSVRNGEFKWIYPYQNNADFVFNSELNYELCVMKKHAIPILSAVDRNSPNYILANRLVKFLKYFESISDKWIPCNSILREFIGDSIFYTEETK